MVRLFKVFLFYSYLFIFISHTNNYNTLHLQFITINSNSWLLNFTLHWNSYSKLLSFTERKKKKELKRTRKTKSTNTIVYILTIKRRLPVFKVFLINLRPGVVCYPHLYISHCPIVHLVYPPPPPPPVPFFYVTSFSPHSSTRSLKRDIEACGEG